MARKNGKQRLEDIEEQERQLSEAQIAAEIALAVKKAEQVEKRIAERESDLLEEEQTPDGGPDVSTKVREDAYKIHEIYRLLLDDRFLPAHSRISAEWVVDLAFTTAKNDYIRAKVLGMDIMCPHCQKIIKRRIPVSFVQILIHYFLLFLRSVQGKGIEQHIDLGKNMVRPNQFNDDGFGVRM